MSRVGMVSATIKARATDSGGFVAVASNGDLDRDNERVQPGCFAPLPASVAVHLDHGKGAASLIGRARPWYDGDKLMIEGQFASTDDAQTARQKVMDGILDSVSIVFLGDKWQNIDGVRTCVKGELLAADLVSIPSNRGALVVSARAPRALGADSVLAIARAEIADAERVIARATVAEARLTLANSAERESKIRGPIRQQTDAMLTDLAKSATETNVSTRIFRSYP